MYRICMYKLYDTFYEVQMLSFDGLDCQVAMESCLVNYKQQLRDAPNVYTRSLTCLDGH